MVSRRRGGASPSSAHGHHRRVWAWGATQARLFTRVAERRGVIQCDAMRRDDLDGAAHDSTQEERPLALDLGW